MIASCFAQHDSIPEVLFELSQLTYRFMCPEFQKLPRTHGGFEDARCQVYIIDMAEKSEWRPQDEKADCLSWSLTLFREMMLALGSQRGAVILLLDRFDLFRQELGDVPLRHHFPDYSGGDDDPAELRKYVCERFITPYQDGKGVIYTHFVQLDDHSDSTFASRCIISSIQDIIIQSIIDDSEKQKKS